MTKSTSRKTLSAAALASLLATPALAHTGHEVSGFVAGIEHPLHGLDHLLAMAAVGMWAALQPLSRAWHGPVLFVAMLAAGAGLGISGVDLPFVEPGILASVVLFGMMVATARRVPAPLGLVLIGGFALLHGHAHGTEAVGAAGSYMAGFMLSSLALHLTGFATARLLSRIDWAVSAAGLAVALAGAALMAS